MQKNASIPVSSYEAAGLGDPHPPPTPLRAPDDDARTHRKHHPKHNEAGDSVVVDTYALIKQAITEHRYPAGAYLREEQLARSLGVSRTPVREAFRRLGAEGWLEVKPNVGVRVKTWSIQDIEDIFEARRLIEPYLVGRAAARIGADDLARASELADHMRLIAAARTDIASSEQWFVANRDFHDLLTVAAGNARLDHSLKMLKEVPLIKWTFNIYSDNDRRRSAGQHLEIVDALRHRDGHWAEAVVTAHILAARHSVITKLRERLTSDCAGANSWPGGKQRARSRQQAKTERSEIKHDLPQTDALKAQWPSLSGDTTC